MFGIKMTIRKGTVDSREREMISADRVSEWLRDV